MLWRHVTFLNFLPGVDDREHAARWPAHAAVDGEVEGIAGAEHHVQDEYGGPRLLVVHEGKAATGSKVRAGRGREGLQRGREGLQRGREGLQRGREGLQRLLASLQRGKIRDRCRHYLT